MTEEAMIDEEEEVEEDIFHSARNLAAELEAGLDGEEEDGAADGPDGVPAGEDRTGHRDGAPPPSAPPPHSVRRWSAALSTPPSGPGSRFRSPSLPDARPFPRAGTHGAGLRLASGRCRLLSGTGGNCARLLRDVSALHDGLAGGIDGARPGLAAAAAGGTPLGHAGGAASSCLSSYIGRTREFAGGVRDGAARAWSESAAGMGESAAGETSSYAAARARCASARKDALRARRRYADAVRDAEGSVRALERAGRGRKGRRRTGTDGSVGGEAERPPAAGGGDGADPAGPSWTEDLRSYASSRGLARQAESVVRSSDDLAACLERYRAAVSAENVAVEECQDAEKRSLDALQELEEGRVRSVSRYIDAVVDGRLEALRGMVFEAPEAAPVAIDGDGAADGPGRDQAPPPPSPSGGGGLFMSPARRRAQSDDGPGEREMRTTDLPGGVFDAARTKKNRNA